MKLDLSERLTLIQVLPKEASFVDMKATRQLVEDLTPGDKEAKQMEIRNIEAPDGKGSAMVWNKKEGEKEKEIKIGEIAENVVVAALKKLNTDKKLTTEHLSLYEKFIKD